MSFIQKNANVFLLFLVVLSALSMVGVAMYAQIRLGVINKDYEAKSTKLQQVEGQLADQEKVLDSVKKEINVTKSRETELSKKYTDTDVAKKKTEQELKEEKKAKDLAEDKLDTALVDLDASNRARAGAELAAQSAQSALVGCESDRKTLQSAFNSCQSTKSNYEGQLSACKSQLSSCCGG